MASDLIRVILADDHLVVRSGLKTILSAAQKGFAGVGYKKVYADYERIVEEVMRTEKLPSSYKYYVKRYFAKIHPNMAEPPPSSAPVEIK